LKGYLSVLTRPKFFSQQTFMDGFGVRVLISSGGSCYVDTIMNRSNPLQGIYDAF
jgi:hypothetical protein